MSTATITARDLLVIGDLYERAATFKGVKLERSFSFRRNSEVLATYPLNQELLIRLDGAGIRHQTLPNVPFFTIVDTHQPTPSLPIIGGENRINWWHFSRSFLTNEDILELSLCVQFSLDERARGIMCQPEIRSGLSGATNPASQTRMATVLCRYLKEAAPPILHELVTAHGQILISWDDLGLAGIRHLEDMFVELTKEHPKLRWLVENEILRLSPTPLTHGSQGAQGPYWVEKDQQPKVLERWREQRKRFIEGL